MIHSRPQSESTGLTPQKDTPNLIYGSGFRLLGWSKLIFTVSCLMDSVHYELTAGYKGPAIYNPRAFQDSISSRQF
ncbi:hypothetical protein T03_11844 [Trichinella britovi]|uniref:Uncharacterized protein n=1 Tax=Trichinella britovi TaxID=45882 RepID=A0A0V1CW66_TRIBR|nr:hypothetical protein T03_11844 [Trichinella britovi]